MGKNKTLELSIKIAGKVDKSLTAAINQSNGILGNLTTTMSRMGTVGLAAMASMAVGTVAALNQCTDAAKQFETSMADVVKYVDGLADSTGRISDKMSENGKTFAENYGIMKDTLLDLSTQIPLTADELTKMAAAAGQSGKSMDDLVKFAADGSITGFLKDTAMMATAMDISADQAGDWAAKWEKAFNMDHSQIMVLADQINYLGANSATTAAEIAQAVNDAASLGQIGGVNVATTAALADAMLATGVSSGRVGTSIKRTITNLSKGSSATKAMKEQWEELGMTAEGVAKAMQVDSVGTLKTIFTAINNLPQERQVAALSTLFGQWAIEGTAKVAGNMKVFTDALEMVNDPNLYTGSMEREFIIKASTAENLDKMMENSKFAMKVELGDAFLPVKKQWALMMTDFYNGLRKNAPELTKLGETLAQVLSNGVTALGDALETALPYIQRGLDYVANNGPEVASTLGKIAGVFVGMKVAPGIQSFLQGAGGLLLGTQKPGSGANRAGGLLGGVKGLLGFGKSAGSGAGGLLSAVFGAAKGNGLGRTIGATISSLISGNGIKGTTGMLNTAAGSPGLLSGFQSIRGVIGNVIAGSGPGRYLGGIASSIGNLGSTLANTKAGGALLGGLNKLTMPARAGLAGMGATAQIYGSILGQKAGGVIGGIANSGAVKAVGGALGSLSGVAKAGAGVLGSVWGPVASGFGSIFTAAAPVIGVVSAIIAVVSILGDNLDGIRTIVGNVFGERGLAVFDGFMGKLENVANFITGLFQDGGVANALAPLRNAITGIFGDNAGAAFDGLVQILQSVMGVVGQVVDFATTYVKPIILDIFNFITGKVMPILLQTFEAAAPIISTIITNVGGAIMTAMTYIAQAIQTVMPFIQGIIEAILTIGSVVIPALLAGIAAFTEQLGPILEGIKTVFGGLIDFITGVFTGNWEKAWTGVKDIFGGIFSTLGALVKAPVNAIIGVLNKISVKIPDWKIFGDLAGKTFGFNIPMLAKGGFTNGPSLAGEAGREAVISFQRRVRGANIATWMQAGRMLGVNGNQAATAAGLREIEARNNAKELKGFDDDRGGIGDGDRFPSGGIVFAPQITIQGNADRAVVEEALQEAEERFEEWYERMERERGRREYR